jgi:hypothetical protein
MGGPLAAIFVGAGPKLEVINFDAAPLKTLAILASFCQNLQPAILDC